MNLIAFETEHLGDVVQADAVGIAVYEKKRGLRSFKFVGSEIVWLQLNRDDALDEVRKLVGRRTELFVFGLDRRAFEGVGRQFRERTPWIYSSGSARPPMREAP